MEVLVLEDEPIVLMDLEFGLEDAGMIANGATNQSDAMGVIDRRVPDAAVLDVNLGGGVTSEAVAARLRSLGVPFVLYSGDLDRRGELVALMDVPLLPKPTPVEEIAKVVAGMVAASR